MHCFCVGANLVSAFAIGYPSEPDDFYIAGETLFGAPLISCRIHGPGGEFLFGLESNKLTADSPSGYRQLGSEERPGWCVQDDAGRQILAVETIEGEEAEEVVRSLAQPSGDGELGAKATRITRIHGEFFDKQGRLAAWGDATGLSLN